MSKVEGVGQCVLTYDHKNDRELCGMTFFQCGVVPVVILSDIGKGVSITNSIESAASIARAMHFLHIKADSIIFFEHYHRDNGSDDFYRVNMRWDLMSERYSSPAFVATSPEELNHLLSCYGYSPMDMPDLRFKPAEVINFRKP